MTWKDTVETTPDGKEKASGVDGNIPPTSSPSPMKSELGNGPTSSYIAKTNVGWTGKKALTYAGTHLEKGRAYSYNKLFDVNIKVTPETQLSYYIHPEFVDKDQLDYSSTYVSIDLAFTDGTYLSDLSAKDQHGVKLNPEAQGKSNTLFPNQWNYRLSDIGKVASGKTIKRILVAYDNPNGPGEFKGSIDDIDIKGQPEHKTYASPIDYVNILRGTNNNREFSRGNNIPAVAVPHGFNFWIPVTDAGDRRWMYKYQQDNNEDNLPEIQSFLLSHSPSPWVGDGDRQTFQIMPSASASDLPPLNRDKRALPFKHENEIAKPNYYSVTFENGIQTEITPTNHAAMFRFTFKDSVSDLIFDNFNNDGGLTLAPDKQHIQGYTDVGTKTPGATRMFFYATFDKPVTQSGKLTGEDRDDVAGYFRFDTSGSDKTVTMKIATSLISIEQAKKNLNQEIHSNDTFKSVQERAKEEWNSLLKKIEVEGATDEELVTLYSNMYRLFLYPNKLYENTGTMEQPVYEYASPFSDLDGKPTETETGAKIVKGKPYVNNGFWDTYRTAWPAYSLLSPNETGEMIDGFLQAYEQGGWIPRWSSPGHGGGMTGTSADVAFTDAYLKGVKNFDVQSFYEAAIKDGSVVSHNQKTGRNGLTTSIFNGYTSTDTGEGLSWAIEGYLNDFAIATISKELAEQTDKEDPKYEQYTTNYKYFINRAQNYVNVFNPDVEFFMGKDPSGKWRTTADKFDPKDWLGSDYVETNAWGTAFSVPHDGQGLANLYGGSKEMAKKLDEFFSIQETALQLGGRNNPIHEMREARDVRMGMYGHSNQGAYHIIYMYDYVGQPWKAQAKVREVLSRLYVGSEIGQGYVGDDDNGAASSWYILSAAGFYPLRAGTSSYAIGAPYFEKMTIHLENGKDIVINAPEVSDTNKYIQSMKLNGKPYNKLTIAHEDLANGATLEFTMGPEPSKWGTGKDAALSSITSSSTNGSSLQPNPMVDLTDKGKGQSYDNSGTIAKALFDNSSDTSLTLKGKNPWIQYNFMDEAQKALMYTITTAKDDPSQDPKNWVLIGSKDGESWTILDKRNNEQFKWRQYTKPFTIQNPGNYSFYRLIIQENGGATSTSLAELELLGLRDLETKFDQVEKTYQGYVESGDIKGAAEKLMSRSLHQAQEQFKNENNEQAIQQLQDFLKQMDEAKTEEVSEKVKTKLGADIHALIDLVSKVTIQPPEGDWEYHEEVEKITAFEIFNLGSDTIEPGEDAIITASVKNIGLVSGDEEINFYFDDKLVDSETVTLEPGESKKVTFTVHAVSPGVHQIKINNQTATLKALYAEKPVLSLSFEEDGETVKDSSPYGLDGQLHGNASRVQGQFGKALKLDGGWVEIPNNSLLNGEDAFTITAWLNLENPDANQKIMGKTTTNDGYLLGVQSGKMYPELWDASGKHHTFEAGSVPANQWVHMALTWKQDGRFIGYINGEEVQNMPASSYPIKDNDTPFIIGAAPWGTEAFQMKGMIDEVRIYKRELSSDEIQPNLNMNAMINDEVLEDRTQVPDTTIAKFSWNVEDESAKVSATFDGEAYKEGTPIDLAGNIGEHTLVVTAANEAGVMKKTYLINVATSVPDMKTLVQRYEKEGAIKNHDAAHALDLQLITVEQFEKKDAADKVLKHLKGFKVLVDDQKKNELISEDAYKALKADADYLLKKWQ
ncbi:GH92 family glycosyl hydrolase [Lederbergia sp. NSJ-179]|uniref:GH92 family glycosyl hydrolase n=1 Tax=Lederbergia sp. NSJ-179 TaxID=2931402 RepID=UPI001FD518B2|nr:GH92 family glycosyl hydrolase [Lederbergia sp. NSJ-179]MCJ7842787.1 GH92 family glycosyl hydrolase [Lederbergia sp. NSJ-179]